MVDSFGHENIVTILHRLPVVNTTHTPTRTHRSLSQRPEREPRFGDKLSPQDMSGYFL